MSDKDTSCMSEFDPDSLVIDEAVQRILNHVKAIGGRESVAIERALGRVSAEPVVAKINTPPFTSSAMDGYAFPYENGRTDYQLVGTSLAGHPFPQVIKPGECTRITTGAALPEGADTVIMQEHVSLSDKVVSFTREPAQGQFARAPGSDTPRGAHLIDAGKQLSAADIALLASQGFAEINVRKKLVVAVISTGDELVTGHEALSNGQIYDSNRPLLFGLIRELGFDCYDGGTVRDNPDLLKQAFDMAAENADVIISSGGVSVGEADFVRSLLEQYGQINFWKIAMKPGRPLLAARFRDAPFFGLPGNPVSVSVTFNQMVRPALEKMAGIQHVSEPISLRARCCNNLSKQPGRLEFQRGVLSKTDQDEWIVATTGLQDSHVLSSLGKANCYIVLPLESSGAKKGEMVDVQLLTQRIAKEIGERDT